MTVRLPPLIKPDRRFSRIRLSEFHFSVAMFKLLVSAVRRVHGFGRVCHRASGRYFPDAFPCLRHNHCRSRWAVKPFICRKMR